MKVSWPFGVALRREASSRLMLRWLKTVVVSDEEKASVEASGGDREGERERIVADVPKLLDDIETGVFRRLRAGQLKTPLRQETIKTLIGVMAVTGMRGGEVVALDDEDFDDSRGLLLVRHAKLGRHRLLPLHA